MAVRIPLGTTTVYNIATRQPGTYSITGVLVPVGLNYIDLVILRSNWNNSDISITVVIDYSLNNGATWTNIVNDTNTCGWCSYDGVNEAPAVGGIMTIPEPSNTNRQIRGSLTITGGAIKMGFKISCY